MTSEAKLERQMAYVPYIHIMQKYVENKVEAEQEKQIKVEHPNQFLLPV